MGNFCSIERQIMENFCSIRRQTMENLYRIGRQTLQNFCITVRNTMSNKIEKKNRLNILRVKIKDFIIPFKRAEHYAQFDQI